jgi:hypothetical protein
MRHDLWLDLRTIWKQLDQVIEYEAGRLNQDDKVILFQSLIDSGLAWSLGPVYSETAAQLIGMGVCRHVPRTMRQDILAH